MFRSKLFWGSVLGVITSVLLFEGKIKLGYSPAWNRVLEVLAVPGTRFANAVFSSGVPDGAWAKFWMGLAIGCNFMIYAFFWFGCIWMVSYFRGRQHPYERQSTLF